MLAPGLVLRMAAIPQRSSADRELLSPVAVGVLVGVVLFTALKG
jgi:hypothetical protein